MESQNNETEVINQEKQQSADKKAAKKAVRDAELSKRIFEVDLLRGIAVFLMIFDHTMFDMFGLLPGVFPDYPVGLAVFASAYWTWTVRAVVRQIALFVFLGLTGVCCSFSRSNLGRGLKLFLVAMGLTLATFILEKIMSRNDLTIAFGVLHCIAVTLVIIGILEKIKLNKWAYLVLGVIMVVAGIIIESHYGENYVLYGEMNTFELVAKTIFGSASCGGDSFPLFLNGGQIFIGVFLGKQFYSEKKSLFGVKYHNNPVTFFGRNSLAVYFLSQIIMPVLVALALVIAGYTLVL